MKHDRSMDMVSYHPQLHMLMYGVRIFPFKITDISCWFRLHEIYVCNNSFCTSHM